MIYLHLPSLSSLFICYMNRGDRLDRREKEGGKKGGVISLKTMLQEWNLARKKLVFVLFVCMLNEKKKRKKKT